MSRAESRPQHRPLPLPGSDPRPPIGETLTLADAIAQLRREEDPAGETTAAMSRDTAAAFDMHDAVHVRFGCGTSLEYEIAAPVWMQFATTANIRDMHRAVANQEHRSVAQIRAEHGIPRVSQ